MTTIENNLIAEIALLGAIHNGLLINNKSLLGIKKDILEWGAERKLTDLNIANEQAMIAEEEQEYKDAVKANDTHEMVDALCDFYVIFTQTIAKVVNSVDDISSEDYTWLLDKYNKYLSIPQQIEDLGYDFFCCMHEVIKEISSRKQDPEQAKRWANGEIEAAEKWQKWKQQPKDTLYKANFELCKKED